MGENKRDIYPFEVTKSNIQGLNSKYSGKILISKIWPLSLWD